MAHNNKKKILLISYYFPPNTAIGGMRIASFAKYFPDEGWDTYVLTLNHDYLDHKNFDLLDSLEDIPISYAANLYSAIKERHFGFLIFLFEYIIARFPA
jgi:hypothetical protein